MQMTMCGSCICKCDSKRSCDFMNRNELNEIFKALGGRAGFIRWSKKSAKNLAAAYQMLGREVLHKGVDDTTPHVAPLTREEFTAKVAPSIFGIIAARDRSNDVQKSDRSDFSDAGAANEKSGRPDICDDKSHT